MTRIILIRHGETVWNNKLKYQGHTDIELSDNGKKQGEKVALFLAKYSIDAIYASDLKRAHATAEFIASYHNLNVGLLPEFREMNFGVWEGLTFNEIQEKYSELAQTWISEPENIIIPKGENFSQVKERSYNAILNLVERHPEQTIVVVSHGATIRSILCAVLGISLNRMWQIKQDNTAVNILDFFSQDVIISLINSTTHLD